MSVVAHVFPVATQQLAQKAVDWQSGTVDTLKVLLVASGTFNWPGTSDSTANYTTVSAFLANAGSGGGGALTEVSTSGTGYTRQTLTGVGFSSSSSGLFSTLTVSGAIQWTSATFSAVYALFYDYTAGGNSDTNGIPICYWDFGGTQSCSSGTFTLTLGSANSVSNALVQYTSS